MGLTVRWALSGIGSICPKVDVWDIIYNSIYSRSGTLHIDDSLSLIGILHRVLFAYQISVCHVCTCILCAMFKSCNACDLWPAPCDTWSPMWHILSHHHIYLRFLPEYELYDLFPSIKYVVIKMSSSILSWWKTIAMKFYLITVQNIFKIRWTLVLFLLELVRLENK